jgi:CPA2 family monovalent cation:H+ antiporter-2
MSSTAVAVKMLEDSGELRSRVGRIALGITIAQDLAVAPMLVVVSNMAPEGGGSVFSMIFEVALTVAILVGLILFLTRRHKVNLPFHEIISPNPDLKPLAAFALCFGFATVAGLIGLSPAFGAFLAGLIVGNSAQRQEVHQNAGPIQAILLMVFFLSIGLLIDLRFVWENIGQILAALAFVTIFKTALNVAILRLQGQSWQNAFSAALVIGQLGEFSFVIAALALSTGVIGGEIHKMIVAVTVLSLVISPVMFDFHKRLRHRAAARVSSLGGLFRLAYLGETRTAKRISRALFALAFRIATWAQLRIDRVRRRQRRRGAKAEKPLSDKIDGPVDPDAPPVSDAAMDDTPGDAKPGS